MYAAVDSRAVSVEQKALSKIILYSFLFIYLFNLTGGAAANKGNQLVYVPVFCYFHHFWIVLYPKSLYRCDH